MNRLHFAFAGNLTVSAYGPDEGLPDIRVTHDAGDASVGMKFNAERARWLAAQLNSAADAYELAERTTGIHGRLRSVGSLKLSGYVCGFVFFVDTRNGERMFEVWGSGTPDHLVEGDEVHLIKTTDREFWRVESFKPGTRGEFHDRFDMNAIYAKGMQYDPELAHLDEEPDDSHRPTPEFIQEQRRAA